MAARNATEVIVVSAAFFFMGAGHAQSPPPDEALLLTLGRIARAGATEACDRAGLERSLGIRIGSLKTLERPNLPHRHQWTDEVSAAEGHPRIKWGRFERIHAEPAGLCQLRLQYEDLEFCDRPADRVRGLIGLVPVPTAVRPHGTGYGYEYWFTSAGGHRTLLLLGSSENPCTSTFLLSSAAAAGTP